MGPIRPATLHDLPGVYRVCLLTGDAGRDASDRFADPDLLGHVYVGPYVVGAPELAFVVADIQGVAGYVLGARDTLAFEAWAEGAWWPPLRERYREPPADDDSADAEIVRLIHAPATSDPAVTADFPAHLHIDLTERARGQGLGRRMIEHLVEAMREQGVPAVHLEVAAENGNAIDFYRHLGFRELAPRPGALLMGRRLDQG